MRSANRVLFNTGILYVKMIITIIISLYTVRLVLAALGAIDYGIFSLVAGVVAMLSFLNTAASAATQRYLSYYQGANSLTMQKNIFANSLIIHILLGFFITVLLLIAGNFLFESFLNIHEDRINAAKTVYYCVVTSILFSILSIPFVASLNAHENMLWIAIVNIIEVILKLLLGIFLFYIESDKLIFYGFALAAIAMLSLILYVSFCLKKYIECSFKIKQYLDVSTLKELTSFAGWNLFGAACSLGRSQGLAVILNLFFGTVINTAYGIANQVSGQLTSFSATMLRALNPQIVKSEGANNRDRMLNLSMIGSKFGFILLAVFAVPCIFEMPALLGVWLVKVPENTLLFCRLIIISSLIVQLTVGLQSAVLAVGKIKIYQLLVGILILLNLPISFFLLKKGYAASAVLISYVAIEIMAGFLRIFILKYIAELSVKQYCYRVIFRLLFPTVISIMVCFAVTALLDCNYRFIVTFFFSFMSFLFCIYLVGLCHEEKQIINNMIRKIFELKKVKRIYNV